MRDVMVEELLEIQSYDPETNSIGDFVRLDNVHNWSGLTRSHRAGLIRYDPIWMAGPHRTGGDGKLDKRSAFSRIGRPAGRADYPCRILRVTYRDGRVDEVGVLPKRNPLQPGRNWDGRFRAEFSVCNRS